MQDTNSPSARGLITRTFLLSLITAVATGCGGSSSSDDDPPLNSGPGNNPPGASQVTTAVPPGVPGLDRPTQNRGLFYTQVIDQPGMAGLFMVDPTNPSQPTLVDGDIGQAFFDSAPHVPDTALPTISANAFDLLFMTFPSGELDNEGRLANLQPAYLFYGNGSYFPQTQMSYRRLEVTDGVETPLPEQVGALDLSPAMVRRLVLNDLLTPENSYILYDAGGGWRQIRLDDDTNIQGTPLTANLHPFSPVSDYDNVRGLGYLVLNEQGETRNLQFVDADSLTVRSGSLTDTDTGAAITGVAAATDLGLRTQDGDIYLALAFGTLAENNRASVWLYSYAPDGPGTLSPVRSGNGKQLTVNRSFLDPQSGAVTPSDDHTTSLNGNPYFLRPIVDEMDSYVQLIGLNGSEWHMLHQREGAGFLGLENAFLIAVGDQLVMEHDGEVVALNAQGGDVRILDTADSWFGQNIHTPILAASDGWIFYNREAGQPVTTYAVALNPVTDERLDIPDWQWVAASGNGAIPSSRLAQQQLSDVFMIGPNAELAAVKAEAPGAGKVNFGPLPNAATSIAFFGTGPGPARLAQAITSGSPASHEVIMLDVNDASSMQPVTAQPSQNAAQRPLSMF